MSDRAPFELLVSQTSVYELPLSTIRGEEAKIFYAENWERNDARWFYIEKKMQNLDARVSGMEREGRKEGERLSREIYDRIDWRSVGGPRRRALASNLFPAAAASSRLMSPYARVEFFSSGLPSRDSYVSLFFSLSPVPINMTPLLSPAGITERKNSRPRIENCVCCHYIAALT